MLKKSILAVALATLAFGQVAKAQTNLQIFYDFGKDRNIFTTTLEGFYGDNWGNTFFFIDYDYQLNNSAPNGTYFEIARCLNFWQNTKLGGLSVQVEYNGGRYNFYGINHAFLAGLDYFLHSKDFRNCFNFKVLYKWIDYGIPDDPNHTRQTYLNGDLYKSNVPLQFTFVWGMQDLFGLKGLRFSGFVDVWGEDVYAWAEKPASKYYMKKDQLVVISEPQLWYNVGQHFGCDNLNIGGEVELSVDFGSCKGFWARPCVGLKWVFEGGSEPWQIFIRSASVSIAQNTQFVLRSSRVSPPS